MPTASRGPGQPDHRAPAAEAGATVGSQRRTGARDRAPARTPDRGAARRTRRPRRARPREGGGAPPHVAAAHPGDARRRGPADDRNLEAPRVQRQPRHRQDDRRPPALADLPVARRRHQGTPRRDRPVGPRRRVRRPDRDPDPEGPGLRHRRHAADRRGVRARPRRRERLRSRGGRHDRQVHGGPPRRPVGRGRRVPDRDAGADRLEPRPEEPVHPHDPLPGLRHRRTGRHLRADLRQARSTTSTRAGRLVWPR